MTPTLSLRCSLCNARIKAPLELLGQTRACPRCGTRFVIRAQPPAAAGPVLVHDDGRSSPRRQAG
jgi:DNA-directed RNA polymerase subunit RPC12/RpoP